MLHNGRVWLRDRKISSPELLLMIELFQCKNIVLLPNFIDNHVKKSYFGKKKISFCTEDSFFPHRWARNAQLLQYVEYCLWWETNNLGLGTTKTVLI